MSAPANKWLTDFQEYIGKCKCEGKQPHVRLNLREGTLIVCDTCKQIRAEMPKSRPRFEQ